VHLNLFTVFEIILLALEIAISLGTKFIVVDVVHFKTEEALFFLFFSVALLNQLI